MGSIKEYWRTWLWRDAITRIVTINFFMWVIVSIGLMIAPNADEWLSLFTLPHLDKLFPARFWTLITYMFVHVDFLHLLANMLWFMLFGRLFTQTQSGKRLIVIYVYGGLAGAIAFLACDWAGISAHAGVLGASCSVLAIVGAVMLISPSWRISLMFFGEVKVIWVALAAVVFFILLAPTPDQSAAHAAGLLIGILYASLRRKGIDIAKPALNVSNYLHLGLKGSISNNPKHDVRNITDADELDELLAKISKSGYQSLSPAQRQRLFDLTQKLK